MHSVALEPLAYLPAAQLAHDELPVEEKVPAEHGVAVHIVAPGVEADEHVEHALLPVRG